MECPVCGRPVEELIDGRCAQCRSEREEWLHAPETLDVTSCAHCGRLQQGSTWVEPNTDVRAVARLALQNAIEVEAGLDDVATESELAWEDERNAVATTRLVGSYRGHQVERSVPTRIRLKRGACQDCSRRFGGYFEAILQLRTARAAGSGATLEKMGEWLEREVDARGQEGRKGAYFSRAEKVRGGFDYYVGGQEVARIVARSLAERFGAEYGESSKLVGRRDGADLFRVTILVRLPAYAPGDFIEIDERPYKVLGFDRKRLLLWDLERAERVQREPRLAKRLRPIGTPEDEREAIVVSRRQRELQVLDPASLKTVDVEAKALDPRLETVRIFHWKEQLYVLPPEAHT